MAIRKTPHLLLVSLLSVTSASAAASAGPGWSQVTRMMEARSCPATVPAPLPDPYALATALQRPGDTACQKLAAIDLLAKALTSPSSQTRYMMVRGLYGAIQRANSSAASALHDMLTIPSPRDSSLVALVANDLQGKLRLDAGHIGDYAAMIVGTPRTSGDLMSFSVSDLEVPGVNHVGAVCSDAALNRVNISGSLWRFTTVTRFCNMKQVGAQSTVFETPFYSQTIQDSDFRSAHIKLGLVNGSPSEAQFIGTDLRGAVFEGEMTGIRFTNCKLSGATINGKICSDDAGADCLD